MKRERATVFAVLLLTACGGAEEGESPPPAPPSIVSGTPFAADPVRGVILISLDALRPDHLGFAGYDQPTSPFLDSLAASGTVFDRAVSQYPATLISHMSMFTGLYPQEHAVFPPNSVLADSIPTLPETLRAAGVRTFGHTEGGFMSGVYGFERGFEEFTDTPVETTTDISRTLRRGLDSLRAVAPDERFFLFLHTYAIHDPYDPPEPLRSRFLPDPAASLSFPPTGPFMREINRGLRRVNPEEVATLRGLYDASILYVDEALARFFDELGSMGLRSETAVILTSDHGEEFFDHGRLAHEQVYPETAMIPLLISHPRQATSFRSSHLVETVDFAPTVLELLSVAGGGGMSGESLLPIVRGEKIESGDAYAEIVYPVAFRTLFRYENGELWQLIVTSPVGEADGTWISRSVSFDTNEPRIEFEAVAFHQPRILKIHVDGDARSARRLPTGWTPITVDLGEAPGRRRVTLSTEGCASEVKLGIGEDPRCHSFKVRGIDLRRLELYNLTRDPRALEDRSGTDFDLARRLAALLRDKTWTPRAVPEDLALPPETESTLKSLGYLD